MQTHLVEGTVIKVWPSLLTQEDCDDLSRRTPKYKVYSVVEKNAPLATFLVKLLQKRTSEFPVVSYNDAQMTYTNSNTPIAWHFDAPRGETHKLLVYLNDVPSGGTIFSRTEQHLVENARGTVVLFDMRVEHVSQSFDPQHRKFALGLRLTPVPL